MIEENLEPTILGDEILEDTQTDVLAFLRMKLHAGDPSDAT